MQEEESDGDDILNVLLKGSKVTYFSQMRIFWCFYVTVQKSRGQTHDRFAQISRAIAFQQQQQQQQILLKIGK